MREQQQLQQQEGYFIGVEVLLENAGLDYPEEPPPAYSELYPHNPANILREEIETESHNRDQETSEMLSTENVEVGEERQLSLTRRRSLT
jgi:hypothetical protein